MPQACSSSRPTPAPTATAVLIQPNLDVSGQQPLVALPASGSATSPTFTAWPARQCKTYIAGIPQTGAPMGEIVCPHYAPIPIWLCGRSRPRPSLKTMPAFRRRSIGLAQVEPGASGGGQHRHGFLARRRRLAQYNSALVVGADGARVGRYDKIHLVPFGEYVPFSNLLFFAHKLTGQVSEFTRGDERKVFRLERPPLRRLHLL